MAEKTSQIRELNDRLRKEGTGGQVFTTHGVKALGRARVLKIMAAVVGYDGFTKDNDPYGEHDFGSVEVDGQKVFWKIDYYDTLLRYHSPDPADPDVTVRLLTVMLADEY